MTETKREELVIEVNTDKMEELALENQELKTKFSMLAEKILIEKKERLGCTDESVNTLEELKLWEAENKESIGVRTGGGSAGRSSLNDNGQQTNSGSFDNQKELIEGVPENVKTQLWEKTVEGIIEKNGKLSMDFSEVEKDFGNVGVGHGRDRRNAQLRKRLLEGRK